MTSTIAAGHRRARNEGLRLAMEIVAFVALGLLLGASVLLLGASSNALLAACVGLAVIQPLYLLQRPLPGRRSA
jgi:hypothetical protein